MKNKSRIMENGITLVALVITIIILLILAGVAITALTQTGLFENAKQAKKAMENAQNTENITLAGYSEKINEVTGSRDTVTINKEEYEDLKNKGKQELIGEGNIKTTSDEITLNKSINNYRYLMFKAQLNGKTNFDVVEVKTIPAQLDSYISLYLLNGFSSRTATMYIKSDNCISTHIIWTSDSAWKSTYVSVYGIF